MSFVKFYDDATLCRTQVKKNLTSCFFETKPEFLGKVRSRIFHFKGSILNYDLQVLKLCLPGACDLKVLRIRNYGRILVR